MNFEQRQHKRMFKRKLHQKKMKKISTSIGGVLSMRWNRFCRMISFRVIRHIQKVKRAKEEARLKKLS